MSPTAIDYEARSRADLAMQRIDDHEDRCGECWTEQRKVMGELARTVADGFKDANDSRRQMHTRMNALVGISAAGACTIAGYALWYTLTHGPTS